MASAAERLARGADLARAVAQVHAVEPEPRHQAEMVGHHQRHVAGVRHRAQRVGGAGHLVLGAGGERQPQAGDVEGVEERRQAGRAAPASKAGGVIR